MKDSTLKLLFAGALTLSGLVAALVVVVTGLVKDMDVQDILLITAIFSNFTVMGAAFFFGHQNGYRNGQRSNGSS